MQATTLFHMLSDETRLRALALIAAHGELCICELVHGLALPQPKVSRHMAALREAGVVRPRRVAQWVFYRLNPGLALWQQQVITATMEGLADAPLLRADTARLRGMENRPARCAA